MLPQPGSAFGRYVMRDKLGRGGMGVVFAAVHTDLDRDVAIKLLSPEYADDAAYRNRFLREAKTLAKLDSPHITRVHDAGEQDGWLFIATELVTGGDLKNYLAKHGTMPIDQACALVREVAAGLVVAHAHGILHRDIKPSNILIRSTPTGLQAVVCDLGIAATLGSEYTKTSGVIGTLGYMAPERHEGRDATVSADVYALGCLLWACLTGDAPYQGTDVQVALGHLNGEIPTLQGQSNSQMVALNAFLQKSMAKRPEDRYATAAEVVAALDHVRAAATGRVVAEAPIETSDLERTIKRPPAYAIDEDPAAVATVVGRPAPAPSTRPAPDPVTVLAAAAPPPRIAENAVRPKRPGIDRGVYSADASLRRHNRNQNVFLLISLLAFVAALSAALAASH